MPDLQPPAGGTADSAAERRRQLLGLTALGRATLARGAAAFASGGIDLAALWEDLAGLDRPTLLALLIEAALIARGSAGAAHFFDPSEPRDPAGRWAEGGGSGAQAGGDKAADKAGAFVRGKGPATR